MAFRLGVEEYTRDDGTTVKRWSSTGTNGEPLHHVAAYDQNGDQVLIVASSDLELATARWETLCKEGN